jgi:hypothetical protein
VNPDPPASAGCPPRAPNAASKIGSGTWPARPRFSKLETPAA